MSSGGENKGKKRTKAFYRKSAYGGKRPRAGSNVLEPGIRGFLVMCNSNESNAVKESYNILNEYADLLFGEEQVAGKSHSPKNVMSSEEDSESEDAEKAVMREVDSLKNTVPTQRRFQNVQTKAKNCVFIRSTVEDPVKLVVTIMEDIAQRGLKKARYAARILPIVGTCKAHTSEIEKLANDVLRSIFSKDNKYVPSSYTIIFKVRNNNSSTCGKTSVIPALTKVVSEINPAVKFSWSDFDIAVLVEVVCTVCCMGVAPSYIRLRKYNLQQLQQGPGPVRCTDGEEIKPCNETCARQGLENDKMSEKNASNTASEEVQSKAEEYGSSAENLVLLTQNSMLAEQNITSGDSASERTEEKNTSITASKELMSCDTSGVTDLNDTNFDGVSVATSGSAVENDNVGVNFLEAEQTGADSGTSNCDLADVQASVVD